MSVLYIVLPLALLIALAALIAFILAATGGQFDDLQTPAHRMLFDDEEAPPPARRGDTQENKAPGNH